MWGKRWYLRIFTIVRKWMRLHSFPGFFGIPMWDVFTFLVGELKREDIGTRANSMAYSFFLILISVYYLYVYPSTLYSH